MTVETWLTEHLKRYPNAKTLDVYKYLHQAVFGSSEAVSQPKNTREWLEFQWENHVVATNTPLVEAIGERWVRLHLFPYQQRQGEFEPLFQAMMKSTEAKTVDLEKMASYWHAFEEMVSKQKKLMQQFPLAELHLLGKAYAAQKWSVPQHTPEFLREYHPVYRVLTRPLAEQLCQSQNMPFI